MQTLSSQSAHLQASEIPPADNVARGSLSSINPIDNADNDHQPKIDESGCVTLREIGEACGYLLAGALVGLAVTTIIAGATVSSCGVGLAFGFAAGGALYACRQCCEGMRTDPEGKGDGMENTIENYPHNTPTLPGKYFENHNNSPYEADPLDLNVHYDNAGDSGFNYAGDW